MTRKTKKKMSRKAILAAVTTSILFTGCGYLDNILDPHNPSNDNPIQVSSSSKNTPSSSSIENPYTPFETWYGSNLEERIMTGFSTETETSGYWYEFDDSPDGGQSGIVWPTLKGNEYNPESLEPIIQVCNGICGKAVLNKGSLTYQPFVGVGFDLAGETSATDNTPAAANASSMGGVCITYTSDAAPVLQMSLGDDVDAQIDYALPTANLPKSTAGTTKFIPWSSFKQPTWYKGNIKFDGEKAAKQLVSLKFLIQAAEGQYNFNISAIGPLGGCSGSTDPVNPPTPQANNFETWFGNQGVYKINTGYDNETETAGYWFDYGDDVDGGLSHIVWPVERGSEYDANALDPIIDYCGGICGIMVLDKGQLPYNPFAGVGFNLGGETSALDFTPFAVDASQMGGVCITYKSDAAPVLKMSLGDVVDQAIDYAIPAASLPKSTVATTKFIRWSDFKQPTWYKGNLRFDGERAAKQLVALRFEVQAHAGSYAFNIQAIGPYNGGTCGNATSNN